MMKTEIRSTALKVTVTCLKPFRPMCEKSYILSFTYP